LCKLPEGAVERNEMNIILRHIRTKKFDSLLTQIGLIAMKECDEFELEHNSTEEIEKAGGGSDQPNAQDKRRFPSA